MTRRTNRSAITRLAGTLLLAGLPALAHAQAQPATAPPASAPAASEEEGALEVTVTYKGKGDVSAAHEISIFLFTDPNITEASEPVGVGTVEANGGHATFKGLPPVVYIAVVYDEAGTYERQGPPTPGTPVFIHGMAAGAAEAVKPGKGAKVSVTFDDSTRM
jgi:hypothetical protein